MGPTRSSTWCDVRRTTGAGAGEITTECPDRVLRSARRAGPDRPSEAARRSRRSHGASRPLHPASPRRSRTLPGMSASRRFVVIAATTTVEIALRLKRSSGCLREGARSYAKRVPTQRCGPALRFRRRGPSGPAHATGPAVRRVRVERHRADAARHSSDTDVSRWAILAAYAVRSETQHEHLAELRRLYGFRSLAGGAGA